MQTPQKPRNTEDLKKLLKQYERVLTPQNKQFINELLNKLDRGAGRNELQDLAVRMQKAAARQKKNSR